MPYPIEEKLVIAVSSSAHIFFDDQKTPHLEAVSKFAPAVHIPFGIMAER